MIETALLVALGFILASLLGLLLARPLRRRAERLTRQRIEASMPISIADIQADKDQLRAEHAISIRRVEIAYEKERDKAARFLVERNKHAVEIAGLKTQLQAIGDQLDEHANASAVLEQTVVKRIPDLEGQLERARQIIAARDRELARLGVAYDNQTEALRVAERTGRRHQAEAEQLRLVLNRGAAGADPAQRGEQQPENLVDQNLKLEAELSRLRDEIARLEDREETENAVLKAEMQRLAELMMGSGAPAAEPTARADGKTEPRAEADGAARKKKRPAARKKAPRRGGVRKRGGSLATRLKALATKEDA